MKRLFTWMMICSALAVSLAGCGSGAISGANSSSSLQTADSEKISSNAPEVLASKTKALIVYYSWSGNTKQLADEIQKQTNADMFEIIPAKPYPREYDTLLKIAKEEKNNNARPALSGGIDRLETYDVVFVGFPNWWSDMPMAIYTFFDAYDLSGKKIIPFCTSGGGGFADSLRAINALEPNAEILDGLHIGGSEAKNTQSAVTEWLNRLGLAK